VIKAGFIFGLYLAQSADVIVSPPNRFTNGEGKLPSMPTMKGVM
jgi:hypothetical protein